MGGERPAPERYAHDEAFTREVMGRRTAATSVPFLLPHLRPGMRVIDCGCGQGSITIDLAELVAPAEVRGIDLRASDLEAARGAAMQRGVQNVTFIEASIYEVPYADGSFDVAIAHQVLHHLSDPLAALRQMRRILRPGGVVSIGDHLWDRVIRTPVVPEADAWDALRLRVIAQNGGTPTFARDQATLLRAAGFSRVECFVTGSSPADTNVITRNYEDARERGGLAGPVPPYFGAVGRPVALEQGWATAAELDAMEAALRAWGNNPDAMWVIPISWALAWK
jgi:SAM-dependent methyltransferase